MVFWLKSFYKRQMRSQELGIQGVHQLQILEKLFLSLVKLVAVFVLLSPTQSSILLYLSFSLLENSDA